MFHLSKLLLIVGAALAIVGSFLPWVMTGDVASYQIPGLVVWADPLFLVGDNGGLLVVVLGILVVGSTLIRPFRHQKAAIMISALCLAMVVAYQWINLIVAKVRWVDLSGDLEPLNGLKVIAAGAILVLVVAIWNYRVHTETVEL